MIYFGLPDIGFEPSPFQAAIIGLGLNGAAYLSEIYRAGIESIHRGQMEAALVARHDAARAPCDTSSCRRRSAPCCRRSPISRSSFSRTPSIVFAVGVVEIMALARNLVTETLQSAAVYLIAGALYLCVTIPMSRLAARLERQRQAWQ